MGTSRGSNAYISERLDRLVTHNDKFFFANTTFRGIHVVENDGKISLK